MKCGWIKPGDMSTPNTGNEVCQPHTWDSVLRKYRSQVGEFSLKDVTFSSKHLTNMDSLFAHAQR